MGGERVNPKRNAPTTPTQWISQRSYFTHAVDFTASAMPCFSRISQRSYFTRETDFTLEEDFTAELCSARDINNNINNDVNIIKLCENYMGRSLNTTEKNCVGRWEYSQDLIGYAIEKAELMNKQSIAYVNSILQTWEDKGITTLESAKYDTEHYSKRNRSGYETESSYSVIPELDWERHFSNSEI